ncbi:DUF2309 domain-containing protein [Gelatiniphilus marinus]|uniref:Probable inorganic carbon transporter subunit DabA n=1 Tax=Gelatiniphilus marinus TaxID=1759464 RepID=A0ABW5JTR2_9FLAO
MQDILKSIEKATQTFGTTWPLYAFVASNPLSGYEHMPFDKAAQLASRLLKASTYPNASEFKAALQRNDIDNDVLLNCLSENQLFESSGFYLKQMLAHEQNKTKAKYGKLDVIMSKWLSAFLDEGLAEWQMPNKEQGFYKAWKLLAVFDASLGKKLITTLPETSLEAIKIVLDKNDICNYQAFFEEHMAALSGWVGYIKHRENNASLWNQSFPITMEDYLAVRLSIAQHIYGKLNNVEAPANNATQFKLKNTWLKAWEQTFQNNLIAAISSNNKVTRPKTVIEAQMVFCIDTRSELIRRHIEAHGNYETYGYAGFFGIAMDYKRFDTNIISKACPPIVGSPYLVTEKPNPEQQNKVHLFKRQKQQGKAMQYVLKRLKNMLPSSFGFVEGAGFFYGLSLIMQTLIPQSFFKIKTKSSNSHEDFCEPEISYNQGCESEGIPIALDEKVAIVKSAFSLTGWQNFAPLVLFVGHGSHTTNNPFASSLDCGACAANPGRHNARLLAKLANLQEVRDVLKTAHNISIPNETLFIGAEHNTTTDAITLFDGNVPTSHLEALAILKQNLAKAQKTATQERLCMESGSIDLALKKATDWDETRPEWGLAKNAGFIIAPRSLTQNTNLDGRCFLHSYNYKQDKTGEALEGILCGPMVVTQWINNHYYFTTVDTDKFGGGSKITHNITGKFGVLQGNGGDIKMGLPLQSLKATDKELYHKPLRLTVVIQAPLKRVENILKKHHHLKNLVDNEWIYLKILDPDNQNLPTSYTKDLKWQVL